MSKCQMKKYLAGGKAVGSASCSSASPGAASQQSAALASLLAQREAQDTMWKTPSTAAVLTKQQQTPSHTTNKAADIDMILNINGDF